MISEVQVRQEVLLGILDHYKRNTVQKLFTTPVVIGAIQGTILQGTIVFEKVFEVPPKISAETQEVLALVDEDYLNFKLELEKQVNSDVDLIGFYICGPQLFTRLTKESTPKSIALPELSKAYDAFKKKSELLFGAVFDTELQVNKEAGIPLIVVEATQTELSKGHSSEGGQSGEHQFRSIAHSIAAD